MSLITKEQYTIIDVGCSQCTHWSGQFCFRSDPAARVSVQCLCGVKVLRSNKASNYHEDLNRTLIKRSYSHFSPILLSSSGSFSGSLRLSQALSGSLRLSQALPGSFRLNHPFLALLSSYSVTVIGTQRLG